MSPYRRIRSTLVVGAGRFASTAGPGPSGGCALPPCCCPGPGPGPCCGPGSCCIGPDTPLFSTGHIRRMVVMRKWQGIQLLRLVTPSTARSSSHSRPLSTTALALPPPPTSSRRARAVQAWSRNRRLAACSRLFTAISCSSFRTGVDSWARCHSRSYPRGAAGSSGAARPVAASANLLTSSRDWESCSAGGSARRRRYSTWIWGSSSRSRSSSRRL
mmetsp:Transcript_28042/g.43326  ORF Transcript_28042/g.43326 Transcript_28042/m.43326 type:complete len:216 (+) Transcript_28042:165-812(+)